jgi:hypothetical protein
LVLIFSGPSGPVEELHPIEHALNIRDDRKDRAFKKLLKRAVAERLISDAGFSHVREDLNDDQAYCRRLIDLLPVLRNTAAHGHNDLHQHALQSLAISADFINQLFCPTGLG